MNPQQRQYGAAPRRRARALATPTPMRGARRRPEWNTYLTDSERYKLSQQQQLQRQLQQLSTAHFVSRSPTHVAAAERAARSAPGTPFTPRSTPSGFGAGSLSARSSAGKAARRLHFADMPLTPASQGGRVPRAASYRSPASASVSFYSDDADPHKPTTPRRRKLDASERADLQNELAVLERMLWDLEAETERLGLQSHAPCRGESEALAASEEQRDLGRDADDLAEASVGEEEDGDARDESGDSANEEMRRRPSFHDDEEGGAAPDDREDGSNLGAICRRSLSIGLAMTQKLDQLSSKLSEERRGRQNQELRVEVLEQELRAMQAKCNYLEAKYESAAAQLDDMREAVTATDAAIHRMAQAFEKTRFHSDRYAPSASTTDRTPSGRNAPSKSPFKRPPAPPPPAEARRQEREQLGVENRPPSNGRQH